MKYAFGLLVVIGLLSASCSHRQELSADQNKITRPGVISVSADWVKMKGKKFDIGLNLTNEHSKSIIVLLKEIKCFKGKNEGMLKHTFFNTGERTIDLRPGQMKAFRFVCDGGDKEDSEMKIVIGKVYENPNDDMKTTGKTLAQNVEWKAAFKKD